MDQLSALLVVKALDGLALRASAISQNVANASSPNYTPLRVNFEGQLRDAAKAGPEAVQHFQPQFVQDVSRAGQGGMRLDLELASASETALRYAALVDVLSRQMQISRLAATGGQ
ncbi:hypothetical protein SZ64_09070 [Erythrobacter sp. SG61-1L]|uniref:flagellar basal body rod protein FlgB n=1 Tax=Erythrobacter sp. SG61-1L TaxID=1603897 RepID=UPI0006C908EF|nr:hypothetical protein [Erythrobacter sp. SG61-1L]KPL68258.1 hypothetical protein SZ64_09070 [Erythrobacter sp. SG61-1L]